MNTYSNEKVIETDGQKKKQYTNAKYLDKKKPLNTDNKKNS